MVCICREPTQLYLHSTEIKVFCIQYNEKLTLQPTRQTQNWTLCWPCPFPTSLAVAASLVRDTFQTWTPWRVTQHLFLLPGTVTGDIRSSTPKRIEDPFILSDRLAVDNMNDTPSHQRPSSIRIDTSFVLRKPHSRTWVLKTQIHICNSTLQARSLVDLPHRDTRARSNAFGETNARWDILCIRWFNFHWWFREWNCVAVKKRRCRCKLHPRSYTETGTECFVSRSDLTLEFWNIGFLRWRRGMRGINLRKLVDHV